MREKQYRVRLEMPHNGARWSVYERGFTPRHAMKRAEERILAEMNIHVKAVRAVKY